MSPCSIRFYDGSITWDEPGTAVGSVATLALTGPTQPNRWYVDPPDPTTIPTAQYAGRAKLLVCEIVDGGSVQKCSKLVVTNNGIPVL